jgi:hypothetical protein
VLEPLDLMARLAALVPPPRMHLTRFHGVFGIEIDRCARCGGKLKIIAGIEEPEVIAKVLSHLRHMAPDQYQIELPLGARAPPGQSQSALTSKTKRGCWPLTRLASADMCRDSAQGRGRAVSGCGQGYLRSAADRAGHAGGRVCRARPVDGRRAFN